MALYKGPNIQGDNVLINFIFFPKIKHIVLQFLMALRVQISKVAKNVNEVKINKLVFPPTEHKSILKYL